MIAYHSSGFPSCLLLLPPALALLAAPIVAAACLPVCRQAGRQAGAAGVVAGGVGDP
jgi:hypothetical protein